VDLNDEISIDHYQENGQLDLAKPVSGVNEELNKNNNRQRVSGGSSQVAKPADSQVNFLLEYFQKNNIQQINLTSEGDLEIKYQDNRTEIANQSDSLLMKGFLQQKGAMSLNYSQLQELTRSNHSLENSKLDSKP